MRCARWARSLESTDDGYLPTTVRGTRALRGPVRVPGTISSQYLTSLLIIAPLIEGGLTIEVEGELTSKPYVDLTLDEMAKFGVQVENQDYRRLRGGDRRRIVRAPSTWKAMRRRRRISRRWRRCTARASRSAISAARTRQGDYAFFALCEQLGARVTRSRREHHHRRAARARRSFDGAVDMTSMPDVAPTLMMIAPFLAGPRASPVSPRCASRNATASPRPRASCASWAWKWRRAPTTWSSSHWMAPGRDPKVVEIETYHDHRIAMSFGVLGSRLPGLRILDPGCVAKTYPNYWRDWQRAREFRAA